MNKNAFIEYRPLNFLIDDVHSIKSINKSKILIDIEKIHFIINLKNRKKEIIFNDALYISELFINLISQEQFMRADVSMKLVFFDIEINTRNIIINLKNNNLFYFRI